MVEKKGAVWVIAEQIEDHIQPVSLQLVGKARQLAENLGTRVEVILLGKNLGISSQNLIASGADCVYEGDSDKLASYNSELYSDIVVKLVKGHQPEILLIGSTFLGRELAPLIAARLGTGLTAHCIDLVLNDDGILEQIIPAYGGMITIVCPERRPQIATVAKGVFLDPVLDLGRSGEIHPIDVPESNSLRVQTLEIVREKSESVSLESAPIIVAGGAGAGDVEGWNEIAQLANVLNAALGSTRPAVDEGWTESGTMIGQSGKMVTPKLYIGVGLSGELQHMVGIKGAELMIAINNDPKAPVFEQVDYGIVEDCRAFVPVLVQKLKIIKGISC